MKKFIWQNRGGITVASGVIISFAVFLFSVLQGQVIGANSGAKESNVKAQKALDEVAEVKADISGIKSDVGWLRQLFERERGIKAVASSTQ